jgi:hypothetical protein
MLARSMDYAGILGILGCEGGEVHSVYRSLPAKKKLFHALRVPTFALQVARSGKITDYGEATPLWREMKASESEDWDAFTGSAYGPLRERLVAELWSLAGRR